MMPKNISDFQTLLFFCHSKIIVNDFFGIRSCFNIVIFLQMLTNVPLTTGGASTSAAMDLGRSFANARSGTSWQKMGNTVKASLLKLGNQNSPTMQVM